MGTTRQSPRTSVALVLFSVIAITSGSYPTFSAQLLQLGGSDVSGEVTIFVVPTGLLGVGSAIGLEANLTSVPSGTDCTGTNACGVHVHSGMACTNSGTQGGHYFATAPDPWASVRYSSTDATGIASFTFSVITDSTAIDGRTFIVHNNAGARVACGILSQSMNVNLATLMPLGNSQATGAVTIHTTASMIVGAGWMSGLEAGLLDTTRGGSNCTATNGCGVHVHSGTDCSSSSGQGGHLLTLGGTDPWTSIRYSSTNASGWADFIFSVSTDNTAVLDKVFIVHNNGGGRVSCGPLRALATTTSTTTSESTTSMTARAMTSSAYAVYSASLAQLSGSGVSGEVTIFLTPNGLVGVGSASGLEPSLIASPLGTDCIAANGCGAHVHSGNSCKDSITQGGHFSNEYPDPWATIRYARTDAGGAANFSFSVFTSSTAISGKPFILHDSTGLRVACGTLSFVAMTRTVALAALDSSGVFGSATFYTRQASSGSMIVAAGWATGLEANLRDNSNGGTDCTAANGCGVHVHSGSDCSNSVGQGGHLRTLTGSDPWTSVRYGKTSPSGLAEFVFSVKTDNFDISGKTFIVHDNAGQRVSCGLISPLSSSYTAVLAQLGNSGVFGEVTISATPTGLHGIGSASSLDANVVEADCAYANGCGVHVHSGTACTDASTQGGHYYSMVPDPWANIRYSSTNAAGNASYTFSVTTNATDIDGKPFIVHNSAGTRVACGILRRSTNERDPQKANSNSSSLNLLLIGATGGGAAVLVLIVLCLCRRSGRRKSSLGVEAAQASPSRSGNQMASTSFYSSPSRDGAISASSQQDEVEGSFDV